MEEKSTAERFGSRTIWEQLEEMARQRIQEFVQSPLEEEVTELVGRPKRRAPQLGGGAAGGYRNGHGKPRLLALMSGTITVERPLSTPAAPQKTLRVDLVEHPRVGDRLAQV